MKLHLAGRQTIEQHIHIIAIADVLRPLAHIERNLRLALAGVAAVELDDPVLKSQPAQLLAQGLFVVHLHVQPKLGRVGLR